MGAYQAWLPALALKDGVLSNLILNEAMVWAKTWFSTPYSISVSTERFRRLRQRSPGTRVWSGPGSVIEVSSAASDVIGRVILGNEPDRGRVNAADRELFQQLTEKSLDQFLKVFSQTFLRQDHIEPAFHTVSGDIGEGIEEGLSFRVTLNKAHDLLEIIICQDCAIRVRKAQTQPKPPARLGLLSDALSEEQVTIGAYVGQCAVQVSEVESMAPGDIIVLDTLVDAPVALTIDRLPAKQLACTIILENDVAQLKMKEAAYV